jgi:hypothetical protein
MAATIFPVLLMGWLGIYLLSWYILMQKAGYPGWWGLIPGFNLYMLTRVADRSGWWTLAFFVPILNIAASLLIWTDIGEKFGKSAGFSVGLAWVNWIFLPILALGDAQLRRESLPSDLDPTLQTNTRRSFYNDKGDFVEEIPLEDWD